ncbi:MAG: efflux RND transporter periplasmic adaptor subunit [Synechococcaceae cyanobacterium]|nr:efflux RND transporter periplasmic adaptor subunit [Synechococcaceae cyanobacterium]
MPTPQSPRPTPVPLPTPPGRPQWRRRTLWAGAGLVALLMVGVAGWQKLRPQPRDVTPFTVLARSGSLAGVITASGELQAIERVNVSPRRQGVIERLYVEEGQMVRRGQPIARMESSDLNDRIQELQANLESAEAELERSRSEVQRNIPLYDQKAISLNDYNRYRADYLVRLQAVRAARQRLEQRLVEREELTVRAPFDGVISQRFADPGAFVTPTTTAAAVAGATSSSIVELSEGLEALARVPESELGRLRLGMPARVRVDAFPDRRFAARVRRIAPRAVRNNNVNSFEVKLELLDPSPQLRIGMTADIDFLTGALQAETLVPTVAIVTEKGRPGVLVVGPRQEPTFQAVELGMSSGRDTQVISGLRRGSRVFIDLPPWAKKRDDR